MLSIQQTSKVVITVDTGKKELVFQLNGIGVNAGNWIASSEGNGGTLKPLFMLKIHPVKGLEFFPVGKDLSKIDPTVLTSQFVSENRKTLPSASNLEATGSILLAIAVRALANQGLDSSALRLDGQTRSKPLTANDWKVAYLAIEAEEKLPEYLRAQFVELMTEQEISVSFEPKKASVNKKASANKPSNGNGNGTVTTVKDAKDLPLVATA